MTLESAAVAFLRASVAWSKAKHSTRKLSCQYAEGLRVAGNLGVIDVGQGICPDEFGRTYTDEWCDNCRKREPLMVERRAALKTYNQARRRAMRALKQETP